jgi:hypothetical protein
MMPDRRGSVFERRNVISRSNSMLPDKALRASLRGSEERGVGVFFSPTLLVGKRISMSETARAASSDGREGTTEARAATA